jgi:hypothetical protein
MSPATKLYADYVSKGPECEHLSNNPWRGRFKIAIRCDNIEEFGFPSFITAYNAKPVLIRNTGTMYRGKHYVEMDVNIHKFGSVPKKALEILITRFDRMYIALGWCVESRKDEEMPETIAGAVNINRPSSSWPDVNPKLFGM